MEKLSLQSFPHTKCPKIVQHQVKFPTAPTAGKVQDRNVKRRLFQLYTHTQYKHKCFKHGAKRLRELVQVFKRYETDIGPHHI